MNQLPDYLLKLSLGLTLIWLFYFVVLRRLTFYNWNRWYLLLYTALAFVIPLVNLNQTLPPRQLAEIPILRSVPAISSVTTVETPYVAAKGDEKQPTEAKNTLPESSRGPFTPAETIVGLLMLGISFMLFRLGLQLLSYFRIKKQALLFSDEDGIKVYHLAKPIVPFSFGNAIFLNPDLHQIKDLPEIMRHELVHVRQRHTFDVLAAELLCALNWYNPLAWLIRHAIRQNLEFIADREVLEKGTEARAYQFLLLKVAGVPEFKLANQFNFSSLKQRIIMMNRLKSARVHLLRFLFVVPLLLVLLAACRTEIDNALQEKTLSPNEGSEVESEYLAGILMDGETNEPIAHLPLEKTISRIDDENGRIKIELVDVQETITTDEDGFYFWKIDVREQTGDKLLCSLKPKDLKFKDLNLMEIHDKLRPTKSENIIFNVKFLTDGRIRGLQETFWVKREGLPKNADEALEKNGIKDLLLQKLPEFSTEHRLIADFRKQYGKPTQTITKFRNGYFNDKGYLVGYEGETEFYLDGEKADYQKINEEFATKPAVLVQNQFGLATHRGLDKKIAYCSFPVFKSPPPKSLLTVQNVQWVDAADFELATLRKEPYMLDGFRQVFGASSNLMPLKGDVKRVAVFKGDLARYYDRKLDKLWWVETRPVEEVMERPDFVAR